MALEVVIQSAEFVTSAVQPDQYPATGFPEVAFAGRSNVGKSSLINCLLQRRKLVRTSRTPGLTQTINFFMVNGAFYFVDLPGYGYAKVPQAVRARWRPMVEGYLGTRRELRGVVQLIDLRHPPSADDLTLWNRLRSRRIPALAVFTKADKVSRPQWAKHAREAAAALGIAPADGVIFSAATRFGWEPLWERLSQWLGDAGLAALGRGLTLVSLSPAGGGEGRVRGSRRPAPAG
jgi:GTP-binding protein